MSAEATRRDGPQSRGGVSGRDGNSRRVPGGRPVCRGPGRAAGHKEQPARPAGTGLVTRTAAGGESFRDRLRWESFGERGVRAELVVPTEQAFQRRRRKFAWRGDTRIRRAAVFQGFNELLDHGDAAVLADRPELRTDALGRHQSLKPRRTKIGFPLSPTMYLGVAFALAYQRSEEAGGRLARWAGVL